MIPKVLLIGCGDIGIRLTSAQPNYRYWGVRRNVAQLPDIITPIAQDLNEHASLTNCWPVKFDYWLVTLTPAERSETAYRRAYVENLSALLVSAGKANYLPRHLVFISSTSIYGDAEPWVNEDSDLNPSHFSGRCMAEAENLIKNSGVSYTIVRCSGIYGPGRNHLLNSVKKGLATERDGRWSNRIHIDDCVGVVKFIFEQVQEGQPVPKVLLASDDCPASLNEVKAWLAHKLGMNYFEEKSSEPLGKRCDNQRLREFGYSFKYPSYREGYASILDSAD